MSKEKFISLKFDFSWKDIFRNEIIRKYFIADVLVEFNDNTKINIELQISTYAHWDRRSLFYLAKMYTEDLRIGQNYAKLKNCINISVLDFEFTKSPEYHTVYRFRDQKGNEFSDVFEIHIIELCKSKENLDMIQTKNPGILEAIKELNIMNLSKRMRMRYEAQMKIIRDRNAREDYVREEGRLIGQEEGILIEQKNIIQKMRAKGHSDEVIANVLDTTPEHILEITGEKTQHA